MDEIEKILAQINEKQEAIEKALKSAAPQSELEALRKEMEALKDAAQKAELKTLGDKIEEQNKILITQGEEITKLKEGTQKPAAGHKTIEGALKAAFEQKEVKDQIAAVVKAEGKMEGPIQLKVVIDMGEDNTIGAGSTQYTLTQNTNIISQIRKRELRYLANVSVGNISTQRALWIEEKDEEGTPIFIGEGDSKTQLSVRYEEETKTVKKIAVYGKVTTELMADLPQLISYIQNNMMRRLDIAIENQLFTGDDTGDNLAGLSEFATAFAAGDLAGTVADANELDVLEAVASQVEIAFGVANAIFIHPTTMSKIKLIKDTMGNPVWQRYVTITGDMVISGMRVIPTTAVTAGDFIGGDLSVVNVLIREELAIQIGLDGNDFIKNKKTMLCEKRLVQFVSANDTQVLVEGDFETAKAALLLEVAP